MSEWQPIETMPEDNADDVDARFLQAAQSVPVLGEPDCYDAGLLGDFGGGNVEWWQDYIRSELARAHDFYVSQWPVVQAPIVSSVVGYLAGGTLMRRKIQGYECKPLVVQPTHSIPAAEFATLREKAAMVDELRKDAEIAVTSIYIALDALNEIIEMDGQDNLGDAKREATKAMAQLAAIAQGKGE